MKKIAYLLGINNYDATGSYGKGANLNGCIQDTETLKEIAKARGFDVIVIKELDCTKARVSKIFEDYSRNSEPGDILMFGFSGHGTYKDIKGERFTGICLADGVLWDTDYRVFLSTIKKSTGVIHIVDSCYSEDNWKGGIMAKSNLCKNKFLPQGEMKLTPKALLPLFTEKYAKTVKVQCNVIAITSSTLKQPSYDLGAKGGHFTLSLKKAVEDSETIANYFQIFNKTAAIMGESDLPQNPTFKTANGNVWKWTYRNFLG